MKNSSNLAFIILILVVLGCSCPKNNESEKSSKTKPTSTEKSKSEDTSSEKDTTPIITSSDNELSLSKFNRIEYGMEYLEVVSILGFDGKIIKVSPDGTVRYLWGDDTKFIMITFMNDKVEIKSQNGLD